MRTQMDFGWVKWAIAIASTLIFVFVLLPNAKGLLPERLPDEQESVQLVTEPMPQEEVDFTTWEQLGGQGLLTHYNVDVWIPSNHAWQRHGDGVVNAALRSAAEYGTHMVLSQRDNGNLHLLTRNEKGEEFVVVINRITKSEDSYQNNYSTLNTAWKLENGATIGSYYQEQVLNAQRCILVRLKFLPNELFFTPNKTWR